MEFLAKVFCRLETIASSVTVFSKTKSSTAPATMLRIHFAIHLVVSVNVGESVAFVALRCGERVGVNLRGV